MGVDAELVHRVPNINGLRHVDDYELGCQSYSEVEEMNSAVQDALNVFELELNAQKTVIQKLPSALSPEWMSVLRKTRFRTGVVQQRDDILDFFDRIFELNTRIGNGAILTYGLKMIRGQNICPENWTDVERLLLQAVLNEPTHIRNVLAIVIDYHCKEFDLDRDALCDTLNAIITEKGRVGHSNEVAWALWGLMRLDLPVDSKAATVISKSEDSVVALLSLDAQSRGLVSKDLKTDIWQEMCTRDELFGENWLVAYEAPLKGWLDTTGDYLRQTPPFSQFANTGVSFYDCSLVGDVKLTGASTVAGLVPLFSR